MKIGVPAEIKTDEYRVALTPAGARELSEHGHEVLVQSGAGNGSAINDTDYEAQGARILPDAEAVFGEAEMVLGVKEHEMHHRAKLMVVERMLGIVPHLTRARQQFQAAAAAQK